MIRLKDLLTEGPDSKFVQQAMKFLQMVQQNGEEYYKKNFSNLKPPKYSYDKGRKYWRMVRTDESGSRSSHLFLDTTNGDILKSASWKGPAKHARGNIFKDLGKGAITPYGAKYLR